MSINKEPKVSIIMGIYNCESTIKDSIESIINQTYNNWELIMCDDCSKDNTLTIARQYADKYKDKVKLIKNNENLTLGPTLNKCLELVEGKYIARQDADDISDCNRIKTQVDFMENNKSWDLVGTGMISFDSEGIYSRRLVKEAPKPKDMMKGTTFAHATILIKSEVMKQLNGYSEENYAKRVEDYDLWFRFFEKGYRGYNLQEYLYFVREDRNSYKRKNISGRVNEINTMIKGIKRLGLSKKNYFRIIRPVIAAITPNIILMNYHKIKFRIKNEVV